MPGIELLEITIKDNFFSRRDMYKLVCKLRQARQTAFIGKVINFGGVKLIVSGIITKSEPVRSGVITKSTHTIFRSQCAQLLLLVEISQEVFQLEDGELGWERLRRFLNVFMLRNAFLQNSHNIEVFLFCRLEYPQFESINAAYREVLGLMGGFNLAQDNLSFAFQMDRGVVYQDVIRKFSLKKLGKKVDGWNVLAN